MHHLVGNGVGMSHERLDFGRRVRAPGGPKVRLMAGMMAFVGVLLYISQKPPPTGAPVNGNDVFVDEVVVEVRGAVPRPGFHRVPMGSTFADALAIAGVSTEDARPVLPGSRIVWNGQEAHEESMSDTLVVGVPLDVNTADANVLQSLPGIGEKRAKDIVAEREARGAFRSVDDLTRVSGIGPKTVDSLRPFLVVRAAESTP